MKQKLSLLRWQFFIWPLQALILLVLCETDVLPVGLWAGEEMSQASFLLLTGVQLLTLCVIPVSLKLLHWTSIRKQFQTEAPSAFRSYLLWNMVRCSLLGMVLLLNLGIYYSMLHTSGALGALIIMAAYAFCWPSELKIKTETSSGQIEAASDVEVE